MNTKTSATPRELWRLPKVCQVTGLGRTALYDRVKRGTFPSPVKLGARAVAWPSDQVTVWIDERIAESRGEMFADV